MSGIDNRAPTSVANPATTTDPKNTSGVDAAELLAGESFNPLAEPGTTGKGQAGQRTKGANQAHGQQGAAATQFTQQATDVSGLSEADAAKQQSAGLIAEKKRTGMASLSETLPMPPSSLRVNQEHLQNFQSLNNEMHEAMSRGAATNQPDMQQMSQALSKLDTSTPEGAAKANQLSGRMAQTAVNVSRSQSNGSNLAAFMALALGFTSKQQAIDGRIQDLTMQGRETLGKQQQAQQEEQAKAMKKAQQKQKALAFLKPLLAVFIAVLTVLTAGTMTGPALALMGAAMAAGFVIGGVVGGKKKGTGFDIGAAFEGLAGGAGAGAMANMLLKGLIQAAEVAATAGLKAGAKAGANAVTKQVTDQLKMFSIRRSGEGSKALDEAAKGGEAVAQKVAEESARGGNKYAAKFVEKTKGFNEAPVAGEGNMLSNAAARVNQATDKMEKTANKSYFLPNAQATMSVSQGVMDATGGMVDAAVNQQRAVAARHEANAKLIAVLEKSLAQEGDRNQEIMESLVQRRKSTFESAETLLKNSNQAATNAIQGIAR